MFIPVFMSVKLTLSRGRTLNFFLALHALTKVNVIPTSIKWVNLIQI